MLTVETYLAVIGAQALALAADAEATGPQAVVPTCPGWTVGDLVDHLGVVHRWATGTIGRTVADQAELKAQALASRPPDRSAGPDWLRAGAAALVARLAEVPDDATGLRFLADPPPHRLFWARRQCHETTVHRVDALAARLGRLPTASEADVAVEVAVDGLDELITGFLPRSRSPLRSSSTLRILIRPDDSPARWTITVSPEPPTVTRSEDEHDVTFTGTAAQLHLGLWNRGDEIVGDPAVLDTWRRLHRVTWS